MLSKLKDARNRIAHMGGHQCDDIPEQEINKVLERAQRDYLDFNDDDDDSPKYIKTVKRAPQPKVSYATAVKLVNNNPVPMQTSKQPVVEWKNIISRLQNANYQLMTKIDSFMDRISYLEGQLQQHNNPSVCEDVRSGASNSDQTTGAASSVNEESLIEKVTYRVLNTMLNLLERKCLGFTKTKDYIITESGSKYSPVKLNEYHDDDDDDDDDDEYENDHPNDGEYTDLIMRDVVAKKRINSDY